MRPLQKVGLVGAGYVIAFAVSFAVVWIYTIATSGPDRQTYGAMYDFGDTLLFLAVFGVAAVPPTGAILFFLRPYRVFWLVLSYVALAIAVTGLAALAVSISCRPAAAQSLVSVWASVASLRILATPLFALCFLLCGCFAPDRSSRFALFLATSGEVTTFVGWLIRSIFHFR